MFVSCFFWQGGFEIQDYCLEFIGLVGFRG